MNRKKKLNETLKKKIKKQNSKLHKSNKPRYISKAERAKMEDAQNAENPIMSEQTSEANGSQEART
jgi:hypothetical protein